ncbi:MAG: DsbA family protein [Proteobacteria bacterium]|nr:DsbA family protein [Pseudomonadota bacterium]
MIRFLLIILFLFAGASHADPKDDAIQELLTQFDAANGDIDKLIAVRYALDEALLITALKGLDNNNLPSFGTGDTVIYEFSDYQCGYCRRMFPVVDAAAENGKATVKLIEFPILGELSTLAASYALAAAKQGRYVEFHRQLMSGDRLNEDHIIAAAQDAGLNLDQLHQFIDSPEMQEQLDNNYRLAALLGVNGTPAFIINGNLYPGALQAEDFNSLLTPQATQ